MSRPIIITGGTGSLGTALARELLRGGDRVAVTYLLPEEAARFEENLGVDESRIKLERVDATDGDAMEAFLARVEKSWGPVFGLAALVGGWAGGRDVETTDDLRFNRMIDLNLRSAFVSVRAAIPFLKRAPYGRIVLVGSRSGLENPSGQAAFNMSKAGVMSLGMTVASELAATEVTTAVLVPSVIDTPATRQALPYADYVDWPTPEQIAAVADFLLSEKAGVMNGAVVPVFGKA